MLLKFLMRKCETQRRFVCAWLYAAVVLQMNSANAEDPAPTEQRQLPQVIVQGQRTATAFDIDNDSFSGFSKTLQRDEFAGRITSVPDVLQQVPGLQTRETGGLGSYSDISLRGTGSKQVAVFLDGMLLNSAQSGQASLQNIPLSILERIDVYPDATPIQLGTAGLAGAVHLQTLKTDLQRSFASVGYGSFATRKADIALFDTVSGWSTLFAAGTMAADNDFELTNRQGFDDDSHAVTQHRYNNGFEQYNALLKTGTQFNANHGVDAMLQYTDSRKQVPTVNNLPNAHGYVDDKDLFTQFNYHFHSGTIGSSHRLYFSTQNNRFIDTRGTVGLRLPTDTNNQENTIGLFNAAYFNAGAHGFSASVDISHGNFTQHDEILEFRRLDASRDSLQFAVEDNWQAIEKYLLINASLRHSNIKDKNDSAVEQGVGAIADLDETMKENSWHLGARSPVTDWLTLQANASDNLRVPSFGERYGNGVNFNGNPELKTETSRNYDLGFALSIGDLSATVAWFDKHIDDGIIVVYDARGIGRPENTDAADIDGIEFDLRYALPGHVNIFTRGAKLDSENRSSISAEKGKKLPGIYHGAYQYGLNWQFSTLTFELCWTDDSELYYNRINNAEADDRHTLDASIGWQLSKNIDLNLSVNNVTDKEYMTYYRLSAPGREAYFTANFNW